MTLGTKRICAAILAVSSTVVGVWALGFPLSFHLDFPAPGRHWVSTLGPYNEHLVRDVGALYLALAVTATWAVRRPSPTAMRVAGGATLIFNAPHFLWHMLHLGVFPMADRIGNAVALGGTLLLSILLLTSSQAGSGTPGEGEGTPPGAGSEGAGGGTGTGTGVVPGSGAGSTGAGGKVIGESGSSSPGSSGIGAPGSSGG